MAWIDSLKVFLGCREQEFRKLYGEEGAKNLILLDERKELQNQIENCKLSYSNALKDKLALEKQLNEAQKNILPNPIEKAMIEKYPSADIRYTRYLLTQKGSTSLQQTPIDVKLFVTPNDSDISNDLKKLFPANKGKIADPNKCNADIVKIYEFTRIGYNYFNDSEIYGLDEVWLFPFELRQMREEKKGGDCEDYAHELASYLISAGVPYWRVWVVVGTIRRGDFGHSTVHVLGDDLKTFYHLNSTSPRAKFATLEEYPTTSDESDWIGIKDYWFSFNNLVSRNKFESNDIFQNFKDTIGSVVSITR